MTPNKIALIGLGFLIAVFVALAIIQPEAKCANCDPKSCYYDLSCGIGCWCYKANDYDLKGVCVPKRGF